MKTQNVLVIVLLFAILVAIIGTAYLALFPRWQYLVFTYDDDVNSEWVSAPFCPDGRDVCQSPQYRELQYYLDALAGQGWELLDGGVIDPRELEYSFTFRRRA